MDEVIVVAYQNPYETYSAPCYKNKFVECQQGDIQIGIKECSAISTGQALCSKMNPNICPAIDGIEATDKSWTKNTSKSILNTLCSYNIDNIKTVNGIKKFKEKFLKQGDEINIQAYDKLMGNFCNQKSIQCPNDPITGKQMTLCSRYVAKNSEGKLCRKYIEEVHNSNDPLRKQKLKNSQYEWCADKGDNYDCRCINSNINPFFNKIKLTISPEYQDSPHLWYKPCFSSSNLRPSTNKQTQPTISFTTDNIKPDIIPYINITQENTTTETTIKQKSTNTHLLLLLITIFIIIIITLISIYL